jgi:hypothetical protein
MRKRNKQAWGIFEEETNDPVKDKGALDVLAESMHISSKKSFSL